MNAPRTITVFTHQFPDDTDGAVRQLIDAASPQGIQLRFPPGERDRHGRRRDPPSPGHVSQYASRPNFSRKRW